MSTLTTLLRPKRGASAVAAAAVISALVAVPLAHSPRAAASVTQSPGLVAGQTLSGDVNPPGQGASFAQSFGSWRGKALQAVTTYTGTDSWSSMTGSTQWVAQTWAPLNAHEVWSVPLIPSDGTSTLETAATGAYNGYFKTLATDMIANGAANATIRLGWEMSGNWFAWTGVNDPTAFAAAYRQVVTTMRSVAGEHFTFDWDPALGQTDPTQMYPGDAYVDVVSADTYDNSWAWNFAASNHTAVWNEVLTENWGLNWLASFASQHGKRLALPEWGVRYMCDGHGGGDDPYFIDQMRSWINTHDVAFEDYFESDDNSCSRFTLTSGLFPNASAEYQKQFGYGAPAPAPAPTTTAAPTTKPAPTTTAAPTKAPTPAPTTTAAPTKAPTPAPTSAPAAAAVTNQLEMSYNSNRSAWGILNRQSIAKPVYFFYPASSSVTKVVFSIDGKAYRTETSAPFDFAGTAVNGAYPFYPGTLSSGQHTLSAVVSTYQGATLKTSATFFVPSGAAKAAKAAKVSATSKLLKVTARRNGGTAAKLDGAKVRGAKYIQLTAAAGSVRAEFILDGKVIRVTSKAHLSATPVFSKNLHKGKHHLVVRMVSKTGKVSVATAAFTIA
jgi:hypothetical protein